MINRFKRFETKSGFTLVEIMIVVAIVALLAAIAVPNYSRHMQRGRATEAVATMSMVRQGMRDYNINTSDYFDITVGNIDSPLPDSVATGVPTPITSGVDIDVGVAQYFSNASFTVDATAPASARFTNPVAQDFIITASGCASVADCTGVPPDCALNIAPVSSFRLEMDNTGRTFVSYDYNCGDGTGNWAIY